MSAAPTLPITHNPYSAGWQAYLAGCIPAVVLAGWLFPLSFLAGHGLFFHDGDISNQIAGWLFFAQDAWQRPLLYTPWLNYPNGLVISQTDSLPLLALLFKPIAGLLPPGFHYFGVWHALALLLQALGAVFLIRGLGCLRWWHGLVAAGFAVLWPVWLMRFGQSALLGQGLLLFALGAYFRGQNGPWSANLATAVLVLLCQVAMLVHPYLLVMSYAILLAWLLDQWRDTRQPLLQVVRLVVALAVTAVLALMLGNLGHLLGPTHIGDPGQWHLNLASLWCGGYSAAWLTCHPGNSEQYAYLGAGALLVIGLALLWRGWRLPAGVRQHLGLASVALVLLAFALGPRIVVANLELIDMAFPAWWQAADQRFPAAARFVWPVTYLVFFVALATLCRRGWVGLVLVLAALALQGIDTTTRRDEIRIAARLPEAATDPAWAPAMRGIAHVSLYPAFGCGDIDPSAYLPVQRQAALHGATFNTARAPGLQTNCDAKLGAMQHEVRPGHLYLAPAVLPAEGLPRGMVLAAQHGQCRTLPIAPVLWGVARPQELLACRAEATDRW